jgi:UDP-3-O-[3-hydroxymyristoyl] N-acetylglucosamine deacetylase
LTAAAPRAGPGRGAGAAAIASVRLTRQVEIDGIGTHFGAPARLTILPGAEGGCISFRRTDFRGAAPIAAEWRAVAATRLATVLGDPARDGVATVEHLMAAFAGLGIRTAEVEVDGPEIPILDGSAAPFVVALTAAGLAPRPRPVAAIRIRDTVRVEDGDAWAELLPIEATDAEATHFELTIEFLEPVIGRQTIAFVLTPETFCDEIAPARTFGRLAEVEELRRMGFAKGSSLANAVAIDHDGRRVLNPEGLRFADEFVRHKALDAVGDLALAGRPLIGRYRSHKGGHRLNHRLLAALFARPEAYEIVSVS